MYPYVHGADPLQSPHHFKEMLVVKLAIKAKIVQWRKYKQTRRDLLEVIHPFALDDMLLVDASVIPCESVARWI